MTVLQLARTLHKNIDEIIDLLSIYDKNTYYRPSTVIYNLDLIKKIADLLDKRLLIEVPKKIETIENKDVFRRIPAPEHALIPRPPVVTIMGHVDHGKTTLLDTLRHSSIVDGEFGGITQHIGAFSVKLRSSETVTFLDTPGHAAFSAMRSRGAHATDIIVLVVAAEDGVLPQTQECISLSKEVEVPLIIAINKIDKPEANIPGCKKMLLQHGVQIEEQGGDVQCIEISALKGINIDLLIESLVIQAEILNLRADVKGPVEATIIEAKQELGRGKLATCLIQRGTLKKGAILTAGKAWAKVRNMFDDSGKPVKSVPPGYPVQVIGWKELPSAGDDVIEVDSEKRAKEVIQWRHEQKLNEKQDEELERIQKIREDDLQEYRRKRQERLDQGLYRNSNRGNVRMDEKMFRYDPRPRLCLVLKTDVDGSLDAILNVLDSYHSEECPLEILSVGVGSVTESDIKMAGLFNGFVYSFNTHIPKSMREFAKNENVTIRSFNIIYRLIEQLKDDISNKLPLIPTEIIIGKAIVQKEFLINEKSKKIPIAGCVCTEGIMKKGDTFKVLRDKFVLHEGPIAEFRHHKSIVDSIKKGTECGIRFEEKDIRFENGDIIVNYRIETIKQRPQWSPPGF